MFFLGNCPLIRAIQQFMKKQQQFMIFLNFFKLINFFVVNYDLILGGWGDGETTIEISQQR